MSKFSRRSFLAGSAAVAGGLPVADHLRFLEPSPGDLVSSEEFLTGKQVVYRTGHSNNCDGACGHLHVLEPSPAGGRHRATTGTERRAGS